MSKGKLNLKGLSTADKIARARQLIQELAESLEISNAASPLAQVTIAVDALESAYSDMHSARQLALSKTSLLHEKEGALESILRNLAGEMNQVKEEPEPSTSGTHRQYNGAAISVNLLNVEAVASTSEVGSEGEIGAGWDKMRTLRRYATEPSQFRLLSLRGYAKGLT